MHRTKRLFQIMQLLRWDRTRTVTRLAAELAVSESTIYRDLATLMASGVSIEHEGGAGYRLSQPFNLPPEIAYRLAELRQTLCTIRQERTQGAELLDEVDPAPEQQSLQDHLERETARSN
jgi:DeoR/GlpR family transcriptional regulator of sugar metabolism